MAESGIVLFKASGPEWYVKLGDPTPVPGSTYTFLASPILNNVGQIHFTATYQLTSGEKHGGWFVGPPGRWRAALTRVATLDGGPISLAAVSRPPAQPLNDNGDLLLWAEIDDSREVLALSRGNSLTIVGRSGDPSGFGGSLDSLYPWPSMGLCLGSLDAYTSGGSADGVHMIFRSGRCRRIRQH